MGLQREWLAPSRLGLAQVDEIIVISAQTQMRTYFFIVARGRSQPESRARFGKPGRAVSPLKLALNLRRASFTPLALRSRAITQRGVFAQLTPNQRRDLLAAGRTRLGIIASHGASAVPLRHAPYSEA